MTNVAIVTYMIQNFPILYSLFNQMDNEHKQQVIQVLKRVINDNLETSEIAQPINDICVSYGFSS